MKQIGKTTKENMGAYGAPLQQNQVHDKHGEWMNKFLKNYEWQTITI